MGNHEKGKPLTGQILKFLYYINASIWLRIDFQIQYCA